MFDLPEVRPYRLQRAPLALALAQVRFPLVARLQTLEGIAPVQDRLRELFPFMEQQTQQEIALAFTPQGPAAPPAVGSSQQWLFTDEAGTKLTVGAGGATLTAGPEYQDIQHFAQQFERVLAAIGEAERMPRCDRLGVRYLDVAEVPPGDDQAWQRWFRPELVGWFGSGILNVDTRAESALCQTSLAAPPGTFLPTAPADVQGLIRHGFVSAQTMIGDLGVQIQRASYILDLDLFVPAPQPYDPPVLAEQFRALHDQIDRFFRWSLTTEGEEYFQLEEAT